jgi:hypothetical protein
MKEETVTYNTIANEVRELACDNCEIDYSKYQFPDDDILIDYAFKLCQHCPDDNSEIAACLCDIDFIQILATAYRGKLKKQHDSLVNLTERIAKLFFLYHKTKLLKWYSEGVELYEQDHKINVQEMHGIPQRGD